VCYSEVLAEKDLTPAEPRDQGGVAFIGGEEIGSLSFKHVTSDFQKSIVMENS
jgi:hypothetical protein